MKFDILNKVSREVQFTAEIDCDEDTSTSIKLGLAVKWGIDNSADLRYANLRSADLRYADLRYAKLIVLYLPIWMVYITKEHARIGCEYHTHEEWEGFTDDEIRNMDRQALKWWKIHKTFVMAGIDLVKNQTEE